MADLPMVRPAEEPNDAPTPDECNPEAPGPEGVTAGGMAVLCPCPQPKGLSRPHMFDIYS